MAALSFVEPSPLAPLSLTFTVRLDVGALVHVSKEPALSVVINKTHNAEIRFEFFTSLMLVGWLM
jgi:hypothetical protein